MKLLSALLEWWYSPLSTASDLQADAALYEEHKTAGFIREDTDGSGGMHGFGAGGGMGGCGDGGGGC